MCLVYHLELYKPFLFFLSFFNQNSHGETVRDLMLQKISFCYIEICVCSKNGGKCFCFYYLINVTVLLFLTNSKTAWRMIKCNITSGYSVPGCDGEIKNILSLNLLLNTQHFTVVVWRLYNSGSRSGFLKQLCLLA